MIGPEAKVYVSVKTFAYISLMAPVVSARCWNFDPHLPQLRGVLLEHNPHHLLKPYASLAQALKFSDIRNYIAALRRSHPYERAEQLLTTLSGSEAEEQVVKGNGRLAGADELKVFRAHEEPPASAPPRLDKAKAQPRPVPAAVRPAKPPEIFALRPEPLLPSTPVHESVTDSEDRDGVGSVWISTALFALLIVLGILLAAYTFVRPFWNP